MSSIWLIILHDIQMKKKEKKKWQVVVLYTSFQQLALKL